MYDPTYNTTKDAPETPTMTLFDGSIVTFHRNVPFGHIYFTLNRGTLPERYQGVYTSLPLAQQAAEQYNEERREAFEDIKQSAVKVSKKKVNGTTESDSGREQLR